MTRHSKSGKVRQRVAFVDSEPAIRSFTRYSRRSFSAPHRSAFTNRPRLITGLDHSMRIPLPALLCTIMLAACGGSARVGSLASPISSTPANLRIYETKTGDFVPFARLAQAAGNVDVVFFGEQHDDPATHAAELAVLAAIGERRANVVLTMEMFERDVQPLLDSYLAGSLSEEKFLEGSRPWPRYTTDYRSLVELARIRGWPVVAANVPRRIASAVSRKGLTALDTMTATERGYSAKDNSCPKDSYYTKFVATMSGHGAGGGPPSAADAESARAINDRFYEAQCLKDETMGESIATALARAGSGAIAFQVDGAFHSDYGLGTAERTRRRAPSARTLVISAVPLADPATAKGADYKDHGDFVLFTRAPVAAPKK